MTVLSSAPYKRALSVRELRAVLLLGTLVRMPAFAISVLVTVHVVTTLHGTYAQAGLVAAVATIATAVSGPWRGRLLDQVGLRRVAVPSVAVAFVAWSIAPWVGYWALLVLVAVAQAFALPSFSIVRQAVMAVVAEEDRRTAIALDSAAIEVSYIVAPAVAIAVAAQWGTSWVILVVQMLGVAGGILLAVVNPRLKGSGEVGADASPAPRRAWLRLPFIGVLAAAAAATLVLSGSDLAIVASVRVLGSPSAIGIILALWGLGSLVGGLLYGALHRSIAASWLLAALAVVTFPLALAGSMSALGALAFVAGLFCAPTITATIDQATRIVPALSRGEAMGWHGSALTAGGAVGAPLAGFAIDHVGHPGAGFAAVALGGLAVAVVGLAATRFGRRAQPLVLPTPQGAATNA